jgi:predicted nucleic acid-binding protein
MEECGAGMIVVDANVIAYFLLQTEKTEVAEEIWKKDMDWLAPLLWRSEVRNILANYIRHNLLAIEQAQVVMDKAHELMHEREHFVSSARVLELAASSRCSAYDCEYVALAQQFGLPLITFDKAIVQNFPAIAMDPQDFLTQGLS